MVGDIGDGEFVQVRGYLFSVGVLGEQGATWFQGVPVQLEHEVVLGVLGGALVAGEGLVEGIGREGDLLVDGEPVLYEPDVCPMGYILDHVVDEAVPLDIVILEVVEYI